MRPYNASKQASGGLKVYGLNESDARVSVPVESFNVSPLATGEIAFEITEARGEVVQMTPDYLMDGNSKIYTGDGLTETTLFFFNEEDTLLEFSFTGQEIGTPDAAKTVWILDDSELTAGVFREGIDKLVYAADATSGSSAGGMTYEQFITTNTEDIAAQQKYYLDHPNAHPAFDVNAVMGENRTDVEAAFSARELHELGTVSSGSSSGLTLTVPTIGIWNLNPSTNERLAPIFSFIKTAIAWIFVYFFETWLWQWFSRLYMTLSVSAPAKGNPVVGGTGAQATSLTVAIGITAGLVSFPVAFWALADSGFTWVTTWTNPFNSPPSGLLSTAIYLVNCIFPLGTAIASASTFLIVQKGGLVLVAGIQTLIRFFVV